jgi:phosphoglycolate phosphatase-like HAD superfamily hydrolase
MFGACRLKVVLLDFDGTIVDTMEAYAEEAARILESMGVPRSRVLPLYRETAGMAFRDQLRLLGLENSLIEEAARRFEISKRALLAELKLDGKVVEFVEKVRRMGLLVYVSTNNECSVVMENEELVKVFNGILCHDPVRGLRKGKAHLELLKEMLGVKECEILFIGDSDYDINLYKGLGVRVLRTRGLWLDADEILHKIETTLSRS